MNLLKIITENKMPKINKSLILITAIILIIVIIIEAIVLVRQDHQEKLLLVMTKEVEEAALRCYNEDKCPNTKIYLKELYNNQYLEKIYNPITKEYLNEESYVTIEENKAKLTIV